MIQDFDGYRWYIIRWYYFEKCCGSNDLMTYVIKDNGKFYLQIFLEEELYV